MLQAPWLQIAAVDCMPQQVQSSPPHHTTATSQTHQDSNPETLVPEWDPMETALARIYLLLCPSVCYDQSEGRRDRSGLCAVCVCLSVQLSVRLSRLSVQCGCLYGCLSVCLFDLPQMTHGPHGPHCLSVRHCGCLSGCPCADLTVCHGWNER